MTVARGSLVAVSIERVLYEASTPSHFFIHARVENLTAGPIFVDLRKATEVFYPNQWTTSTKPNREAVDERRLRITGPLTPQEEAEVLTAQRSGELVDISPQGVVDYFREFNRSGRADVEQQSSGMAYVIVIIDGQLRVTDGRRVERLLAPEDDAPREVAIPIPVQWSALLPTHRVVAER